MTARVPLSAATRAAGLVVALGYLLGLVPGPLVAAVGGLALITFGRALLVDRVGEFRAGASLAMIAGAVGVAGLRWGSLALGDVRGVQSVLGPTLLVEPASVATGCALAAGGALLALAVWMSTLRPVGRATLLLWSLEGLAGSLAIVSVFWGPALGAEPVSASIAWVGATLATFVPAGFIALLLGRRPARLTWLALALSAVTILAGAILVAANI